MGRVAVIKISSDGTNQGFLVTLQMCREDGLPVAKIGSARLPAHPEIESSYLMWQTRFQGLKVRGNSHWEIDSIPTQRATSEGADVCLEWAKTLEGNMQDWLQASTDKQWQKIREKLKEELGKHSDKMRLIIEADTTLWKLPWEQWDLLESYPDLGISFSLPDYEREETIAKTVATGKVRILAVLGDSTDINLNPDRDALANLNGADTKFLEEPTASDFIEKLRHPQGWDILFFAGHSETKDKIGRIFINEQENLQTDQFRNALKAAIKNGLKIAIFNSCEGLGLVEEIAKLKLPVAIFMQEKVPDEVAQFFLKEFLTEYSQGEALPTAFRRAQARLEKFTYLPGVTWLPRLYQNPGEIPPTWKELCNPKQNETEKIERSPAPKRPSIVTTIVASALVTAAVVGMRSLGFFQSWELQAYDYLMRQRPSEAPDTRLLIVGADEPDIRKYKHPLPDEILAKLIDKLQQYQPAVIGLDIYRDLPVEPGHAAIVAQLQQNKRLITVCKFTSKSGNINPPPQSPVERIGFNNLPLDEPDYTVRRYFLSRSPNPVTEYDRCNTGHSFSFQLVYRYLKAKGIPVKTTSDDNWQFGYIIYKHLETHSGGYQNIDARGNQVLLNYRASSQIAQQVTVTDILTERFEPSWIKGKIVLIGVTAASVPDPQDTPYGRMRGLHVHAHMVSEILSAVEDKRSLLWWLPIWGDGLWIFVWSITGGIIILFVQRSPLHFGLAISIALALLYGLCLVLFIQGGWFPLIPPAIALLTTGIAVVAYTELKTKNTK